MPRHYKKGKELLQFCTIKCKLSSIIAEGRRSPAFEKIAEVMLVAHKSFKLASLFFKAFCLEIDDVPPVNHSTMITTRSKSGANRKSTDLAWEMETFWEKKFRLVYPDRVNCVGNSRIKATVADELVKCVLTNVTTHFRSRCARLCRILGLEKRKAFSNVSLAFLGRWDEVDLTVREPLCRVFPSDPAKQSVIYNMKKNPSRYVSATFRLEKESASTAKKEEEDTSVGSSSPSKERKISKEFCFAPTRRSCVPTHVKIDTETCAQVTMRYSEAVKERKDAIERRDFNDLVWGKILDRKTVDRKLRKGFRFHHEISTDGVAVSILYSQPVPRGSKSKVGETDIQIDSEANPRPLSKSVGLDPGKRNVATMVDGDGTKLRYTSRQRTSESLVFRYRDVLQKLNKENDVNTLIAELSQHSHRTNDPEKFFAYLEAKKRFDEKTRDFYRRERWRNMRFRIFSRRKGSQDRFLDRVASTYGPECYVYYGDWSRRDQMAGCDPSPTIGLRKALRKRFNVTDVDEYRTSKTCNRCLGELSKYRKRDSRWSYSRLCCTNCGHLNDRSKRFVDRDQNAAANILLVGTSECRPESMRRTTKRSSEEAPFESSKKRRKYSKTEKKNQLSMQSEHRVTHRRF